MGKRNSQRKNAATSDSDYTDSVSSSSIVERQELDKKSVLDECLDALYEKRGSKREKALVLIIGAFKSNLQHEFVEKKFVTLLHQCLISIKRGYNDERALASHAIGFLALTTGSGEKAEEIFQESLSFVLEPLKSRFESFETFASLKCLAIITFVGGNKAEETEKSMQIMLQVVHPKKGSNVVATRPPSPALITAVVSAWSFLFTTLDGRTLNPERLQEWMSYFSTLLDKADRCVRIAAVEALALIFEMENLEKLPNIQGLRAKIVDRVRDLSMEAGGNGVSKKDLKSQRNSFRDILEFLENGYAPETLMKIGGESLTISSWHQLIQLNFLKGFLGGGFVNHMQENEFLRDLFGFTPMRKLLSEMGHRISGTEKRLLKSPNSITNKARTRLMKEKRKLSQDNKLSTCSEEGYIN